MTFYVWWKCRNWFQRPNYYIYWGRKIWFFGADRYYISAVGWKYESMNGITLFRKWQLIFTFNYAILGDDCSYTRDIAT